MASGIAGRRPTRLSRRLRNVRAGVRNTLELLREGRLAAPYRAPFDVEHETRVFRLRHYPRPDAAARPLRQPILFVPPLMVASEIYDMSPELSAVAWLSEQGADVWLVDFGAPEVEEGGMQRTLDDHVVAVDEAVDFVREATGADVHLAGYSQGGMFVYQACAYRRSKNIASVITFGSPVDVHRNAPGLHEDVAVQLFEGASPAAKALFDKLGGLPGFMSMAGFKVMSGAKEFQQMLEFFKVIHDREKAEKRERQRRFLGGEGFVAWPGPALRKFIDEMLVNNRLVTGGLVINSRPVTLADITVPLLYFVGSRDEFGRPPSVRAIQTAAPNADVHEVELNAGHFGLVVGSKSLRITWPAVMDWMAWLEGAGEKPALEGDAPDASEPAADTATGLYDLAVDMFDGLWHKVGDVSVEGARMVENLRWQLPRMVRMRRLQDGEQASVAQALAEQAQVLGDQPFFLWQDRSFTYAQAQQRVDSIAAGLLEQGVVMAEPVGVLMDNHPDYLTVVCALNRIGAVAVLLNAGARGTTLAHAMQVGRVKRLVVDAAHVAAAKDSPAEKILVMGEVKGRQPKRVVRFEQNLPVALPAGAVVNEGRSEQLALLIFTSGTTGLPKAVQISNRRWLAGALSAAAAVRVTSRDTVYCCLPLYHATGMMLAVGGALIGGARLALVPRFSASQFWPDVRRYGATVVIYVGELCRYLVSAPAHPRDRDHPVRVFAGNGLRADVWETLLERFAPEQVIEFYASSEGNVSLVNLTGDKVGSVGRSLVDNSALELVCCDVATGEPERDADGRVVRCGVDQPGLLISRIDFEHPLTRFDGYADPQATESKIVRDAFEPGDAWFNSGDLLRCDADGDYWFVDRVGDTFRWHGENVSTQQVADALDKLPEVLASAVYGIELPGREGRAGMAAVQMRPGQVFDGAAVYRHVAGELTSAARPRVIRLVESLETTDSLKFTKLALQEQGADPAGVDDPLWRLDSKAQAYVPMLAEDYPEALDQ